MKITTFPRDILAPVIVRDDVHTSGAEWCGDGVYLSFVQHRTNPEWTTNVLCGVELTVSEAEHLHGVLGRALRDGRVLA